MISTITQQSITNTKKALSHSIINNNYNLLATDVIQLSQELDNKMLPLFKQQLDFYNLYLRLNTQKAT
ncbi:MAG: hypothetical protein BEN19_03520 [Epulopiscium sp. Nuni2H_MBin003]|nr:MAG: hypothetical protein BEN19_03520 [Epulopiscium sp. Nuni2H_MBin003]